MTLDSDFRTCDVLPGSAMAEETDPMVPAWERGQAGCIVRHCQRQCTPAWQRLPLLDGTSLLTPAVWCSLPVLFPGQCVQGPPLPWHRAGQGPYGDNCYRAKLDTLSPSEVSP